MKTLNMIPLIIFAAMALIGCGTQKQVAPKSNVTPSVLLRSFPKQDWRLANNKFFLWRQNMTAEQARMAMNISADIDELDGQALPLTRQAIALEAQIDPIKETIKELNSSLRAVKSLQDKTNKKLNTTNKEVLDTEAKLQAEQAKTPQNTEEIKKLSDTLTQLKSTQTELTQQLTELKASREKYENQIAAQKAILAPKTEELDTLEVKRLEIENKGRARVDEIMTVVDWYKDQPTSVALQFEADGSLSASISGWNLGDDAGARNFNTNPGLGGKPTIRGLSYEEFGGVYRFTVDVYTDEAQTQLRESFAFKISRIKYDHPDGRNFFGGEIINTIYGKDGNSTRKGMAKLVDRNN